MSVEPASSCFLNSTKPGRSKKNGSSRDTGEGLAAAADVGDAEGGALVGRGRAVATVVPVQAFGPGRGAGGALDRVVLDHVPLGERAGVAELDPVGDVGDPLRFVSMLNW